MPVFLFMYVEVPVGPAGSMRQNPIQPRDATKSGSCEMIVLVPHNRNEKKTFPKLFQTNEKDKCSHGFLKYQVTHRVHLVEM